MANTIESRMGKWSLFNLPTKYQQQQQPLEKELNGQKTLTIWSDHCSSLNGKLFRKGISTRHWPFTRIIHSFIWMFNHAEWTSGQLMSIRPRSSAFGIGHLNADTIIQFPYPEYQLISFGRFKLNSPENHWTSRTVQCWNSRNGKIFINSNRNRTQHHSVVIAIESNGAQSAWPPIPHSRKRYFRNKLNEI